MAEGVKEKPFAFAIPADQGDRRRVAQMVELLQSHRIEVGRAREAFTVSEGSYPAGTFVVRLDQPYRNYAVDLLVPQKFPTDSPFTPYNDVSWALPAHYGVEAKAIADEKIKAVTLDPAGSEVEAGRVAGSGAVFLLRDTGQEALLAARLRLASFRVEVAERAFKTQPQTDGKPDTAEYPAGSSIIPTQPGLADALGRVARELSLDFQAAATPDVPRHEAPLPRLAVWHTWDDTESVGWIRYTMDREKIPYAYIRDDDIRAGGLRAKYDLILFGNNYLGLQGQIHGVDKRWGPMPYTKTAQFPSHGVPDSSTTSRAGSAGAASRTSRSSWTRRAARHVGQRLGSRAGGRARAGRLSRGRWRLHAGLGAKGDVHTTGASAGVRLFQDDVRLPVLIYGLRREARRSRARRPSMGNEAAEGRPRGGGQGQGGRPGRQGEREKSEQDLVVSGGAKNGDDLEGMPAIIDVRVGRGRVIVYNFNPMHRDLNRSDFRFLWNAILNWKHLVERK